LAEEDNQTKYSKKAAPQTGSFFVLGPWMAIKI
jgi:hypothetical protein